MAKFNKRTAAPAAPAAARDPEAAPLRIVLLRPLPYDGGELDAGTPLAEIRLAGQFSLPFLTRCLEDGFAGVQP